MDEHILDRAIYESELEAAGLLDPGQPTWTATVEHRRQMESEFTPRERRLIRSTLGIGKEAP